MTLLKNLRPEIAAKIDADKTKYPNLTSSITNMLSDNISVFDISVGVASQLIDYLAATDLDPNTDNFMLKLYFIFGR